MPSLRNTVALAAASFTAPALGAYSLKDNYQPSQFFNQFTFWTSADPTHGYVDYVSQSDANSEGLIQTNSDSIYMGVDMNTTASGSGRKSVRISSTKTYDDGLFVIDVEHMPVGCGAWPAFWLVGPNWPSGGEIDIIEGVDVGSTNQATLHTSTGCTINQKPKGLTSSSQVIGETCASGAGNNQGCGITTSNTNTYGTGLNANKGGVYATEVTANQIAIYFFERGSVPSDVTGGSPDPTGWGDPFALFTGCDVSKYFKDMQIVFDTTFCGDWANATWTSDAQCSKKAASCQAYVQGHPEGFEETYWTVNSLKVYSGSVSASANSTGEPTSLPLSTSKVTSSRTESPSATHTPYKPSSSSFSWAPAGSSSYPSGSGAAFPTGTAPIGTAPGYPISTGGVPVAAQPGEAGQPPQAGQPSFSWNHPAPSWGAWGGHGGRGRPSDTPGSEQQKRKRHALEHLARGRAARH